MKTKRRLFPVLLVFLVVFILIASYYFILHETRHDCTGEECPVCALIAVCRNTLKSFSSALFLIASYLFVLRFRGFFAPEYEKTQNNDTPVSLKVRLLN